jgi:hypothetical protein
MVCEDQNWTIKQLADGGSRSLSESGVPGKLRERKEWVMWWNSKMEICLRTVVQTNIDTDGCVDTHGLVCLQVSSLYLRRWSKNNDTPVTRSTPSAHILVSKVFVQLKELGMTPGLQQGSYMMTPEYLVLKNQGNAQKRNNEGVNLLEQCLLGRCSTSWAIPPILFVLGIFEIGSLKLFAWAGFEPQSSQSQPPK